MAPTSRPPDASETPAYGGAGEFPKMVYRGGAQRIVKDAEAQQKLGKGWSEHPNPAQGPGAPSSTRATSDLDES